MKRRCEMGLEEECAMGVEDGRSLVARPQRGARRLRTIHMSTMVYIYIIDTHIKLTAEGCHTTRALWRREGPTFRHPVESVSPFPPSIPRFPA